MPDVMDSSVPEFKRDEVALLMKDLGIINKADFGTVSSGGTGAGTNQVGIIEHFRYSTQMLSMSNDNLEFFNVLKGEIDNNRPVFLSLPGHATVVDGYNEGPAGRNFHINMGWGGTDNNFYYLNGIIETSQYYFDTTPPKLSMTYNIKPCSSANNDCYETLSVPETTDSINGSTISGQFNRDGDVDIYSVYLKGATSISGNRGYSNQAFYISVYNSKHELMISSDAPILSYQFPTDKYYIEISLGWYDYDSRIAYTVNISTQPITDTEKAEIASRDTPPVINNDFKPLYTKEAYQIRIDSGDAEGNVVSLSATGSNANVTVSVDKDVLTITPQVSSGSGEITVKATANGKETTKTFSVFIADLWQISKADAVSLAKSQGKKILLLAGRDTCGNTQYMRNTVCESASPAIRNLLQQNFILWYCDVDNSTEWYSYASGLPENWVLPLICVIDPNNSDIFLDRITGVQDSQTFYSWLLKYVTATRIINLIGNPVFGDVQVNTTKTLTFTISNSGNSPLTVSSITYPAGFTGNWNSGTIAAGGSQIVTLTFAPTATQTYSGTVVINSDKTVGTSTMQISGTGIITPALISVSISGLSTIAESSYSDYKTTAVLNDGTTQ
ncbi:MAG TPA: hypothetical protein DCQ37_12945, partial [Desulfobacteraceae bacterium]|nr:hypothetical protein [Desulfobacteraceae bacterium]